ncbi:peptidylprolyl isomerase [Novosphingobium sp. BL-8H]|uniref:peptidylprolyl isomerase n=1 Tax=Novosphingobium sp. BL-8H TaxID=3127640 RepID=UPI0037573CC1
MRKFLLASVLSASFSTPLLAAEAAAPATPSGIVAAAPASEWVRIAPENLLVMDLAPDAAGKPRRVVIQLIGAPFSQDWVENIRKLAAAHWYDGIAVVRVQDNYVVQWGDPDGEDAKKAKPLPAGLAPTSQRNYSVAISSLPANSRTLPPPIQVCTGGQCPDQPALPGNLDWRPYVARNDIYAQRTTFKNGFPIGVDLDAGLAWPVHCYGYIGVGRNMSPDAGTGAELYAVIGHAPRQLDRNVAVVGRVIEGIEYLSSLPRGTDEMGFYASPSERVRIAKVRMGTAVADLPGYQYLSTESDSFAAYAAKRANRKDDFYTQPAGGADVCNVPVPIRIAK